MIKILPIILLTGCASAAIQVEETADMCIVTGSLLSLSPVEQEAPASPSAQFQYKYIGDNCTVKVWSDNAYSEN